MNKKNPIMIGTIIVIAIGIVSAYSINLVNEDILNDDNTENKQHDYVWSGPLGVTQYEHRLGDDIFMVMRGLQPNEKGAVEIFTPRGVLFNSFEYDGSQKSNFNLFFYPDTSKFIKICTPEELVGIWKAVFANDAYPTLEFKMTDEYLQGAEASITTVC